MIVLFFLELELGRGMNVLSVDGLLVAFTGIMILVLPYFLPGGYENPFFGSWLLTRVGVAAVGGVLGLFYGLGIGTVLPESFKFVPMTLLILTGMVSCYIQFYFLLKLRLVK
ncbi:MAG: hypothetical protein ABR530_05620 [Pyrinomonadaceae bacterium]